MPVSWLMEHASAAVRYRLATDVFPGLLDAAALEALRAETESSAPVKSAIKKQKDTGVWGGNLLGVSPNKTAGIKDVGTIPQYRRLIELGLDPEHRALRIASRVLYRLVSRDEDPKLLFEYGKYDVAEPGDEPWIRPYLREAAAGALAHGGADEDPRVRGAAHKILNQISGFLRSDLSSDPFVKSGGRWVLNPAAQPPTVFSVALFAWLPAIQRERAGLVERLGQYLGTTASKKAFSVPIGKKSLKPTFLVLGDPLIVTAAGQTADLPFGLYWMEVLARLNLLQQSVSAGRLWSRLMKDCDKGGVWHPKNLRALPKASTPWSWHMFPLEPDLKKAEARQVDVTFRMALIARLAGLDLTQH